MMPGTIRLGTRGSALARWQTDYVRGLVQVAWPDVVFTTDVVTTRGDKVLDVPLPVIGGKGLFTAELEAALRGGHIDLAVHSLKDLPTESPEGLTIGAIPHRVNPRDVLISRDGYTLGTLPAGAKIGSSSRRRAAQLLHRRPDLQIIDIRGNVDTRVRKALDGQYDAIVLAHAGLERLGHLSAITQVFDLEDMLPAPGQGALGVQCRADAASCALLEPINDPQTQAAVSAERAFLAGLGGGCAVPIAAYAEFDPQGQLRLRGRVSAVDGSMQIDVSDCAQVGESSMVTAAQHLGAALARVALERGAAAILTSAPK